MRLRYTISLLVAIFATHLEMSRAADRCGMEFTTACVGHHPKKSCHILLDSRLRGGDTSTDVDSRMGGNDAQKPVNQWDQEDVGAFVRGLKDDFGQNTTDSYAEIFR